MAKEKIEYRLVITDEGSTKLEKFEKKATKTDKSVKKTKKSVKELNQTIVNLGINIDNTGRKIEKTTQKTEKFNKKVKNTGKTSIATKAGILAVAAAVGLFAKKVVAASKEMETLEVQFKVLLGNARAAKERIGELARTAAKTPFTLSQYAKASRVLQTLSGGALASGDGLRMVGDVAASTGADFENLAMWVGRAYDGLRSNRPVGEAMMRLQELGIVSGTTRNNIEELTKAGKGMEAWLLLKSDLDGFKGGMEELSQTAEGLSSTLSDTWDLFLRRVNESTGALEIWKKTLKASIETLNGAADGITNFNVAYEKSTSNTEKLEIATKKLNEEIEQANTTRKLGVGLLGTESKQALEEIRPSIILWRARKKAAQEAINSEIEFKALKSGRRTEPDKVVTKKDKKKDKTDPDALMRQIKVMSQMQADALDKEKRDRKNHERKVAEIVTRAKEFQKNLTMTDTERQLEALKEQFDQEKQIIGENLDGQIDLWAEYQLRKSEIIQNANAKEAEFLREQAAKRKGIQEQSVADQSAIVRQNISNAQSDVISGVNAFTSILDKNISIRKQNLNDYEQFLRDKGETEEEIGKKTAAKRKDLAKKEKALQITRLIIDTVIAAQQAYNSAQNLPPPANFIVGGIAAGVVATGGAAAVAAASSKNFAAGGIVDGPRSGDQMNIGVNGNEIIMNETQQGNLSTFLTGQNGSMTRQRQKELMSFLERPNTTTNNTSSNIVVNVEYNGSDDPNTFKNNVVQAVREAQDELLIPS